MAKKRAIVTGFSGYPETIGFFFPDAGLATIASALLNAGVPCKVFDFNTRSLLELLAVFKKRPKMVVIA